MHSVPAVVVLERAVQYRVFLTHNLSSGLYSMDKNEFGLENHESEKMLDE